MPNTKVYPYCCIGVITGKFGQYPFHGSGCLIASRVVLTCAHNLYDQKHKREPTDLMFTPGMNGKLGREPIKVKRFHYSEEYKKNGASEFDFGVL